MQVKVLLTVACRSKVCTAVRNVKRLYSQSCMKMVDLPAIERSAHKVLVEYCRGRPRLTIPLPSRMEECRFTFVPLLNTAADLVAAIGKEDNGITRVQLLTKCGEPVDLSQTIDRLLDKNFKLIINNLQYTIHVPPKPVPTAEEIQILYEVTPLLQNLYEALNHRTGKRKLEFDIMRKLECLEKALIPVDDEMQTLNDITDTQTSKYEWFRICTMGMSFGFFARLTWWEFSWDVMEPVCYFYEYATIMGSYIFYVLHRKQSDYHRIGDTEYLIKFHKKAKKYGFNVKKYNRLMDEITQLEQDLLAIRRPIRYAMLGHSPPATPTKAEFKCASNTGIKNPCPQKSIGRDDSTKNNFTYLY